MKTKKQKKEVSELRSSTLRVARAHFFYVLIYAAVVMMYDSWKLIPYEQSLQRWTVVVFMMFIGTGVWYASRYKTKNNNYYKAILMAIIALDIFVAAFSVYVGRGMASRGVALFAIPIVISALISRPAIFATAAFSVTAYWFAALRYFFLHPSEGYRIELYADLIFYSACFFIMAGMLYIVRTRSKIVD
jgi:hypothetical protein